MKKLLSITLLFLSMLTSQKLMAQYFWLGNGTGAWNTGTAWSATSGGAAVGTFVASTTVYNFNLAGSIDVPTVSVPFTTLNCTENVSVTGTPSPTSLRWGAGGLVTTIDVASNKLFDFGAFITPTSIGGVTKNGEGAVAYGGATSTSNTTLNAGTIITRNQNTFGSNAAAVLNINGGTIGTISTITTFSNLRPGTININSNFSFGSGVVTSTDVNTNMSFAAAVNLGATGNRAITLNGTATYTLSGIIGSTGAGLQTGSGSTGTLLLSGANTYTGPTTITGGTLTLGATGVIPDASLINFNGGTLKSGTTAGFTETFATANLSNNSTLALGSGVHTLNFADSKGISWSVGKTLTITGWAGGYDGTTGTAGKIFVGTDATGLTALQLSQIQFLNGNQLHVAIQLPTGEIVPTATFTLPITLISFLSKLVDNRVVLSWETASEINNNRFEVLRSTDNKTYVKIAEVLGNGTTNQKSNYVAYDANPENGVNYYKLIQIDNDGTSEELGIRFINFSLDNSEKIKVYPNPASEFLNVQINNTNGAQAVSIKLIGINGSVSLRKDIQLTKGFNNYKLDLTEKIVPGQYILNIEGLGIQESVKVYIK